ncbi:MAG TPA: polysaccharide deacetylase family protein [Burkholderiales bacterium]|nr:polysaccharide deacetylase family protein [Burkholderiales bacterium]
MSAVLLMYHMVDTPQTSAEARFCRAPHRFREDLEHLRDARYNVMSLSDASAFLKGETAWPRKAAVITFDDGAACGYTHALPILKTFGYSASFFTVTNLIDGHNDWAQAHGFSRRRMLSKQEIREMDAAGMNFGSHTASHCRLAQANPNRLQTELNDSKAQLEDILGHQVEHFAYPYGSWNANARDAVIAAGYSLACSTVPGKVRRNCDPFLIRRVEIKGDDTPLQFSLKLRFGTQDMPPVSDARRFARRTLEGLGVLRPRTTA